MAASYQATITRRVGVSPATSFLLERHYGNLADRMLMATAREVGTMLVTRDADILAYAASRHLRALAC